ncbi:MAG: hypothetical protein ACRDTM_06400 [Micromonosporaceae bacterium]
MSTFFRIISRSTMVVVLAMLIVVPVAGSAQANPADHRLTSAERALTAEGAALRLARANSEPGTLSHLYTRGDISCHYGTFYKYVKHRAWGSDMPRYTEIEVQMDLYINGRWWKGYQRFVTTSGSGTWSTPTYENPTNLYGEYKLIVYAYGPNGYGQGSDTCRL